MRRALRPGLPWGSPATWLRLLGLAAAYYGLAWLGLHFALSDSVASPVWPPAGLAVAAGVLWGRRALPAVTIAAFLVELTAGVAPVWSALMAAGNTLEAAAAAWIVTRAGGATAFRRPTGVLQFALAAALAPLAAASLGTMAMMQGGHIPAEALRATWATWYLGDMAGILMLTPVLLLATQGGLRWPKPAVQLEAAVAFGLLAAASVFVFIVVSAPVTAFVMAPLVWIAIRLGPLPASIAVLLLDTAAVVATSNGNGPYAPLGPDRAFLLLQAFMLTVSLLAQAVAAVADERRRASADLERRVQERTVLLEEEVRRRRKAQDAADEAQHIARVGSWELDVARDQVTWSAELRNIVGIGARVPVTPRTYLEHVHPDDRERVESVVRRAAEAGAPFMFDSRVVRPDGQVRSLHTEGRTDLGADGKPSRLVGVSQDLTERRAAQHALAESLQRFRLLAENSPIGIVHCSPTGSINYANQTWIDITGVADYRDDDAVRLAVHSEDRAAGREAWEEALRAGKPFMKDLRWVRPDGSVRLTVCRAVAVRDHDGRISGFVSTVSDITERQQHEEAHEKEREARLEVRRLQELADYKTNFLRTAAHELGTPLTPIKIQLRVLRDLLQRRPTPEETKAITILDRNVDRLQLLVRDLLESARMQSGRLRLNPRSMDLAHVVHDVVETFQEPAIHGGIALDAQVPNEMPMVGDPDRVTQVLYNLISNAMKFTGSGGRVHVVAEDVGDLVRFVVEDNGPGFTPEQAALLFQPFTQVHDPMQAKAGSGLGLYISRGIVEQHGGSINAFSEGPGQGARFTVTLPRVARPPAPAASPVAEPKPREARLGEAPQGH